MEGSPAVSSSRRPRTVKSNHQEGFRFKWYVIADDI